MTDELLSYYNRELAFLRHMGQQFAAAHPKIAGRLRLDDDLSQDPHVARMVEAFAYLNARTRHKLDDDFPEIAEAMLSALLPHYLSPLPPMAISQFTLDKATSDPTASYSIPRHSPVQTESIEGQPCRFQTCYDLTLWPLEITQAQYRGQPVQVPETQFSSRTAAVLRIRLQTYAPEVRLAQLPLDALRIFLSGQSQLVHDVYETLMTRVLAVLLVDPQGGSPVILPKSCLQPVGFGRAEAILPESARTLSAYRLLTEYFAYPQKFFFVALSQLTAGHLEKFGASCDVCFLLDRHRKDFEQHIRSQTFQLGCTPVINLFHRRAEPIPLTQTQYAYRVIPDSRRPLAHEIYSIDRVVATSVHDEKIEFQPFYSTRHARTERHPAFWHASRRQASYADGQVDQGTEIYLSFVDLEFESAIRSGWTVDVETTCLNRDFVERLPTGEGQPRLQLAKGGASLLSRCLVRPTRTLRPSLRYGTYWRLISHLSLNHLALTDTSQGAEALREILQLYDYAGSEEAKQMIDGLKSIAYQRVVRRIGGEVSGGMCRGLQVRLELDEKEFSGGGAYLFASVLDRFMSLYAALNSFTETVAVIRRTSGERDQWAWPLRPGDRTSL